MAEHDAADQEHLGQVAQGELVAKPPEHHERDDVARILGPVQQAAAALVELLAARRGSGNVDSPGPCARAAPSSPSIRTRCTAFPSAQP